MYTRYPLPLPSIPSLTNTGFQAGVDQSLVPPPMKPLPTPTATPPAFQPSASMQPAAPQQPMNLGEWSAQQFGFQPARGLLADPSMGFVPAPMPTQPQGQQPAIQQPSLQSQQQSSGMGFDPAMGAGFGILPGVFAGGLFR